MPPVHLEVVELLKFLSDNINNNYVLSTQGLEVEYKGHKWYVSQCPGFVLLRKRIFRDFGGRFAEGKWVYCPNTNYSEELFYIGNSELCRNWLLNKQFKRLEYNVAVNVSEQLIEDIPKYYKIVKMAYDEQETPK